MLCINVNSLAFINSLLAFIRRSWNWRSVWFDDVGVEWINILCGFWNVIIDICLSSSFVFLLALSLFVFCKKRSDLDKLH
jgi:hypothetical protein